jgi:LacI family transcriptional regulator
MAIRMKDIARDLGVSIVTVSKVLSNDHDIGLKTRERVLRRIKELNYQPNPTARALATGRTHLIGLVVPDLVHQFFAQVAKGASRVFRKKGYGLIITSSEEDQELERQEIDQMIARRLDALIVASTQLKPEVFQTMEAHHSNYVLIDRRIKGLHANFVGIDDVRVGAMATGHLLENGCRKIAYIGGRFASTAVDRLTGYRQAHRTYGQSVSERYIMCRNHFDDSADATGYAAMKRLLQMKTPPDGVFCANDPVAVGAMNAILEAGLNIPNDVALIGCGNTLYGPLLRVPLSSIDQDSEMLGELAAKVTLELLDSKDKLPPKSILLEPKLIVRESSQKNGSRKV